MAIAHTGTESASKHFSTARRGTRLRTADPLPPLGILRLSISWVPSLSHFLNSQPGFFSLIWNKRRLTEIQGYSFCVKDKTKSLSHSLGANTEDNGYQHSRLFMVSLEHLPLWMLFYYSTKAYTSCLLLTQTYSRTKSLKKMPFCKMYSLSQTATQSMRCFIKHPQTTDPLSEFFSVFHCVSAFLIK